MQKNMTDRTPGSYDDFVAYLGTVRTEEELFSRLTGSPGRTAPRTSSAAPSWWRRGRRSWASGRA